MKSFYYTLNQAPCACWFDRVKGQIWFSFSSATLDHDSLFTRIILSYSTSALICINNILVTSISESEVLILFADLNTTFALKDLGKIYYFLLPRHTG